MRSHSKTSCNSCRPIPTPSVISRPNLATLTPVSDVVFVIHGIRDKGYWTRKIARVVVRKGRRAVASGRRARTHLWLFCDAALSVSLDATGQSRMAARLICHGEMLASGSGRVVHRPQQRHLHPGGCSDVMPRRAHQERRIRRQRREIRFRVGPVYPDRTTRTSAARSPAS